LITDATAVIFLATSSPERAASGLFGRTPGVRPCVPADSLLV
jgi:hypothetical protein